MNAYVQNDIMPEKTIREYLARLTEPEAGEAASSGKGAAKASSSSGKGKARPARGGGAASAASASAASVEEGPAGLVKYLPAAHREAVQALVEAAEGKRAAPVRYIYVCVGLMA
jgi:hypothetical protein